MDRLGYSLSAFFTDQKSKSQMKISSKSDRRGARFSSLRSSSYTRVQRARLRRKKWMEIGDYDRFFSNETPVGLISVTLLTVCLPGVSTIACAPNSRLRQRQKSAPKDKTQTNNRTASAKHDANGSNPCCSYNNRLSLFLVVVEVGRSKAGKVSMNRTSKIVDEHRNLYGKNAKAHDSSTMNTGNLAPPLGVAPPQQHVGVSGRGR